MAKQSELLATVTEVTAQLDKIGTEVRGLKDQLENLPVPDDASQELVDAVDALKAKAQTIDDLVPDLVVPPTDPTPVADE